MTECREMIGAGDLSRLLMVGRERLRQLARAGHIPAAARGRYPLAEAVRGYVNFLERSRRGDPASAGLADAKAREVTLRIERQHAALIDTSDAERTLADALNTLRTETARSATALSPALQQQVQAALDTAFARAERQAATAFADLRAGRDPLGDE